MNFHYSVSISTYMKALQYIFSHFLSFRKSVTGSIKRWVKLNFIFMTLNLREVREHKD